MNYNPDSTEQVDIMALIEASFDKTQSQVNMHKMQDEYVSNSGGIVKGGNKLKAILDKAK
jgi:hypothetical protein